MLKMSHDQSLTPYEQRLRDEVIYLHSLWHKPPPNPNSFAPSSTLHVFHPTSFKKTKRNKPTYQNPHQNTVFSESGSAPLQQMQYKVVQHCSEFLSKSFGEDDSFIDDKGVEESEEFKFLFGFFVEHRELRDLYENNQDSGDFYCLVCGHTQLFKGCFSLVQHALQMLNVNRKRAHRAFSLVICKLLGWDISKLPVIVLKGEPLRQSLANLGKTLNYLNDDGKKVSGMEGGVTDYEWPYPKPVDEFTSTSSGWPALNPKKSSVINKATAEELARFSMAQLQQQCVEKCKSLLSVLSGSESEEDENDSDNDSIDEDVSEECEEYKVFLRLFTEENELREYYEKHYEDGEFYCMVCGAIRKKVWKTYKGCIALVQHAIAISRTKKKRAHRMFGQVICKVLGWDIGRLPTIVLKKEPVMAELGMLQNSLDDNDAKVHVDGLEKENFRTDESGVVNHETSATEGGTEANNIADDLGNDGLNQK
ncbi:uncharacterized protein LOC126669425 [Mercurialis annua]|uniref:uncharacterized protein LOC126669425 n=1 Tax=Mercurialis annua TaxID=3986 RepID=UPI00215E6BA0|nr:uncharacterized protein LOC126669425 [Mercurialis annua]XP_050218843.1 uncharacterized protein LOC126669425 [Mercurialis annua]XP_050218844.1 uncharacterized protein LOC126669425 [Mercurialis annua]